MEASESEAADPVEGTPGSTRPNRVRKARASFDDTSFDTSAENRAESKKKKKKKGAAKAAPEPKKVEPRPSFSAPTAAHVVPFLLSPVKRPRGRPPLAAKRQPILPIPQTVLAMVPQSSAAAMPSPPLPLPSTLPPQPLPQPSLLPLQFPLAQPPSTATAKSSEETAKMPRPPYQKVVSQLISVLMTSDPLTLQELSKRMDDFPKDMIQSAIDVLQVFSLVVQVKAKQGLRPECQAGTVLYCLSKFAKGPTAVPLGQIIAHTREKEENEKKILRRVDALNELGAREMSKSERKTALLALLDKFQEEDSDLLSNPLYGHVVAALSDE